MREIQLQVQHSLSLCACLTLCTCHGASLTVSVSGYVLPYIVIVDMAVLFMMGTHRLRHMGEALLSLGLVVCLAVSPLPLLADSKPLKSKMKSHQSKCNPQIIFIIFICTISISLFVNQSCILQVTVQHFAIHLSATLQNSHPVLFSSYYWLIFEFIIDSCCGCGSPL